MIEDPTRLDRHRPPAGDRGRTPLLLAFDTSTDRLSVAVQMADGERLVHEAEGGPRASAVLLPAILSLLARAGLTLHRLDAIAFGRGPGAFTGLRTACSVAQGLAFGAGRPVLPIDTLLAVAEDAREQDPAAARTWAVLDARMDEVYAARYAFDGIGWSALDAPYLTTPEALVERWRVDPPERVAGNALRVFGTRLDAGAAVLRLEARPRAAALLPIATALWQAGGGLDAALALPLYLRDKVAQTIVERAAARAAKEAAAR